LFDKLQLVDCFSAASTHASCFKLGGRRQTEVCRTLSDKLQLVDRFSAASTFAGGFNLREAASTFAGGDKLKFVEHCSISFSLSTVSGVLQPTRGGDKLKFVEHCRTLSSIVGHCRALSGVTVTYFR
jgi:hypothetical protein